MPIMLQNHSPASGAQGVSASTDIQVDIVRIAPVLLLSEIEIYVEGEHAFQGGSVPPFVGQFAGPGSTVTSVPDGYRIVLDRVTNFRNEFVNVQVRQSDGYSSVPVGGWSFRVGSGAVSDFYFSDGYGVRRLHVRQLVGEWKPYENPNTDGYAMPIILAKALMPTWPSDTVRSLSGAQVDGYLFLVASTDKGVAVTKNETGNLRVYSKPDPLADGYDACTAHMTAAGTLYVLNKTMNRLEVYYGADFRAAARPPDFWYDTSSTPPLGDGYVSALHVAEECSTVLNGGSRIYVGCGRYPDGTGGSLTKIEAYDKQTDGYGDGKDGFGRSYTYGIAGSTTDFPILGGTVPDVVAINSDETNGVLLVATNDGSEIGGGLSQLSISYNIRLFFMTKESGHLPSNVINDIALP